MVAELVFLYLKGSKYAQGRVMLLCFASLYQKEVRDCISYH